MTYAQQGSQIATARRRFRRRTAGYSVLMILALSSCRSVIDKPAAAEVSAQTDLFATQAKDYYGTIIQGYNGMLFSIVALNRGCAWGRNITLHSEQSAAVIRAERQRLLARTSRRDRDGRAQIAGDLRGEGCVTDKERAVLARHALATGALPVTVPLTTLSQRTFGVEFDLLGALSKYSKVLAELSDAPKVTTKEDLLAIVDQLASVRNDANSVAAAWQSLGAPAGAAKPAEFIHFNVDTLRGHVERIGGLISLIQTIAENEEDARKIRKLALEKKDAVNSQIAALRQSFIDNFDTLVLLAQNQEITNSEVLRRSDKLSFSERRALVAAIAENEIEVARLTQMKSDQLAAGNDPEKAVIPQVKMADALRKANDKLVRVAQGRYSAAEKRDIALATLRNLRDVFKSASSAVAPLLAL